MPYSTANAIKIYYEVSGAGLPFIMIHANPFDHNLWMYQIAHFSTYFKVIAIDIRGYGRSDKPTTPFSLTDMADDVLGVCRDEGVKEAILGGVSVGSGMALLLGLDHPDMFKAVILVGGNSGGAGSIADRIHGYTKIGIEKYHIQHLRELVAPDFPETKLGKYLLNTFVERDPWLSGESIAQIFRARGGTDMTSRLGSMTVPTLVINGEYDNSLASGKKTASLIPGAVHKILPKPDTPAASKIPPASMILSSSSCAPMDSCRLHLAGSKRCHSIGPATIAGRDRRGCQYRETKKYGAPKGNGLSYRQARPYRLAGEPTSKNPPPSIPECWASKCPMSTLKR